MCAHLAAIDRVDLAHLVLDEGVTALAHDRLAAQLLGDLKRIPRQTRIVDNARALILFQECLGEEADHVVALDEAALLVKEEAAVKVAVPCHTEVCPRLTHDLRSRLTVLLQNGVRHAVREIAVRLVVDLDQLEGQELLHRIDDRASRTVARIYDDLVRFQLAHIDIGEDMLDIFIQYILLLDMSRRGCGVGIGAADRHRCDVLEPRIA